MRAFYKTTYLIIFFFLSFKTIFANIDISVSPVKYELEFNPWETINKTIKLFNNTNVKQNIFINTKNAISMQSWWQPLFVESIENPELYLASWITPSVTDIEIDPLEIKDIPITINIPSNAAPGWHYAAVFFNVKENEDWQISLKKRIWVLVLLKVPWNVNASWSIDNIYINSNTINNENKINNNKGENQNNDFLNNLLNFFNYDIKIKWNKNSDNDNFNVDFIIDFSNKWNIHIKPTWKIIITDEKWEKLKNIWKETVKDKNWVVIWEKIVDYIPINDEEWNVLPNTKRVFEQNWKWFAYKTNNENDEEVIDFNSPWEFFSKKNIDSLFPWEKACTKNVEKTFNAKFDLFYMDPNWNKVSFSPNKDFNINYYESCKTIKWSFIIFWSQILLIIIILWLFLFLFRRKKCPKCKKVIKKDMKICPYCSYDLKKKKVLKIKK